MEGYLTLPEAARHIGISRAVLWRHVQAGHLQGVQRVGRWYLIPAAEAERFRIEKPKPGRPRKRPAP